MRASSTPCLAPPLQRAAMDAALAQSKDHQGWQARRHGKRSRPPQTSAFPLCRLFLATQLLRLRGRDRWGAEEAARGRGRTERVRLRERGGERAQHGRRPQETRCTPRQRATHSRRELRLFTASRQRCAQSHAQAREMACAVGGERCPGSAHRGRCNAEGAGGRRCCGCTKRVRASKR